MGRNQKLIPYAIIARVPLFVILFLFSVAGNPLRCHSIESNTTELNERVWQEFVIWNNEMLINEPLLNSTSRNHTVSPMLPVVSVEEFENQTIKQFELLKMYFSQVVREIDKSKNDVECGPYLPKIMIERLTYLKQIISEIKTTITKKITCASCKAGLQNFLCSGDKMYVVRVGFLLYYIKFGKTINDVINISYKFCIIIQTDRVCNGITQLFSEGVVYVFKRITLSPKEICSVLMNADCDDVYSPNHDWNLIFPPIPKPTVVATPDFKEIRSGFLKVLHLSDTHFDPYYVEGTNANCGEPLCCRITNSPAKSVADRAGRWGDYRACDTPKRTIDHMLQHINSTHPDIAYILWTGDLPAHDIWNQTHEGNVNILKETVEQMSTSFPGIPIYPALGNHETVPVNSFPPSFLQNELAINWLYDELDKNWRKWLPTSTSSTIRRGAFYSVLVKPGFRVISLNMNYCNNLNWWLLMNSTDPENELQWFIYELQNAELNEEKVHVIGHIPPGHSDCLKVWSRNYYSIINRYESTITAQFFGHTHFDEFELFYDQKDLDRAIGISYICPSVTPFINLNPGYRIYYVDGDRDHSTRAVLDHETWVMNLDEANLYGYTTWYKLYSARDAYQMPNLTPVDWNNLVYKLAENELLFDKYFRYYWKNSSVKPFCDQECKQRMICDLRSGRSHDRETFCNEMKNRIGINQNSDRKA